MGILLIKSLPISAQLRSLKVRCAYRLLLSLIRMHALPLLQISSDPNMLKYGTQQTLFTAKD